MNKVVTRVLLFFIAIPLLVCVIFLLPHFSHLAINLIAVTLSVIGAFEFREFFNRSGHPDSGPLIPLLSGILPVSAYLELSGILPGGWFEASILISATMILAIQIFPGKREDFSDILPRYAVSMAVLFYPSFFVSYFVRLSSLPNASMVIVSFIFIVFATDTGAYLFGSIAGARTRGIVRISPNKSLVGFICGMVCSIGIAAICRVLFPAVFGNSWALALAAGLIIGMTTLVGDLIESAFKRSVNVKDSGAIIPGRGGVLDSIDSLLIGAAVFYYLIQVTS